MTIEHFTKEQFEEALPRHKTTGKPLWEYAGCLDGEHVYTMPVIVKGEKTPKVQIEIRSSVGANGHSMDTGENSIRAWLTYFDHDSKTWKPLGSKVQKYVTRMPGWQERMVGMLRTLYRWRLDAGDCKVCGKPKHIFIVKHDGPNRGRVFARCEKDAHQTRSWRWLTPGQEGITKEAKK